MPVPLASALEPGTTIPPPVAPSELLAWLASLPVAERDAAIDARLGITIAGPLDAPPGPHLVGYHPSGVAAILRALAEVPVLRDDVFVDLGSGLGKPVLLARLLTGATARGVEIQPALVDHARDTAARLGLEVRFDVADARDAYLEDGTVFFLYLPFTGPVLAAVLERLRRVAARRRIVICALGVDLDFAPWLARRAVEAFWLAIYDSVVPAPGLTRPASTSELSPLFPHSALLRALTAE